MTLKNGEGSIEDLQKLMRVWILEMTTAAGSGHPTSSLSAVEVMSVLFFGRAHRDGAFFHYDLEKPEDNANDRIIFSKGHASPLYYALWAAADILSAEDLMTFRKFDSILEGHPTRRFPLTEVPTGSLGQGLSVGVGEALALRAQGSGARTFVLLGDSEMAEGQVWEAMGIAAHYKLGTLTAIVDVNRLGQRGETMLGYDVSAYQKRAEAFGWHAITVDGHDNVAIAQAYSEAMRDSSKPTMIVAQTIKGRGVSFLENRDGWHGKSLSEEELAQALNEIGVVERGARGVIARPQKTDVTRDGATQTYHLPEYVQGESVAPRTAYGDALAVMAVADNSVVALDAETSNSTKAEAVKKHTPEQFYEMFIAEQNMASVAVGMARRGLQPFASTFAAFLTRAADQIRMAQYAGVDVTFVGSHCGVSIGADGASQMGVEDMALFAALQEGTILYPCDAVSTAQCVAHARYARGITYLRITREALPVIYASDAVFRIGGSHVLRQTQQDHAVIFAAGITVHEALKAADQLAAEGIAVRVVDCYSVRPLDVETVRAALRETKHAVVVEDHHASGGLGATIKAVVSCGDCTMTHLCVRRTPRSGTPGELLAYEGIDAAAIVQAVKARREMV